MYGTQFAHTQKAVHEKLTCLWQKPVCIKNRRI
jgi:hypothetical protein